MQIYAFSSDNWTNIWAGVGARTWAVSLKLARSKGTVTKSQKLKVGSLGILYCSETHEFTIPFLVKTVPKEGTVVSHIWREDWALPFTILPLGPPEKRLSKDLIAKEMPSVVSSGKQWQTILHVQPTFSFQASNISADDWAFLFEKLGG